MPFGDGRPVDDPVEWLRLGAQIIALGDDQLFIEHGAYDALARFVQGSRSG